MAEIKISTFIVGMIFASIIVVFFGVFMSEVSNSYSLTYDNTTFSSYNKLSEIANTTKKIRDTEENIREKGGVLDIIGGYVSDAYNTLKVSKESISAFESMTNAGINKLNLGISGDSLKIAITTSILILIVVGVILSALLKWAV